MSLEASAGGESLHIGRAQGSFARMETARLALHGFWENFLIAILGLYHTLVEMGVYERFTTWVSGKPQFEARL